MLPFDYQATRTDFKSDLNRLRRTARLAAELGSEWCYYWIEPTSDDLDFAATFRIGVLHRIGNQLIDQKSEGNCVVC